MKKLNFRWMLLLGILLSAQLVFGLCYAQDFFTPEINRLIDKNYQKVEKNGSAKLVIPAKMFNHDPFAIPADAKSDMDYVVKSGHEVLIVGGSVRDAILGSTINDADFATDATPEQLAEIVPNTKIYTTPAGFVVAQAWHGDECTDMATFQSLPTWLRGEPGFKKYSEGKYSKDVLEDSWSRDLTINSVYYDYKTGNLIDYHGGLHDLREGIIRSAVDPNIILKNKPQNLLRSVRFASRFNFKFDPATADAARKYLPECDALGAKGIAYDLINGFHDGCMVRTYKAYKDYGILKRYFLVISDLLDTPEYENYILKAYTELDAKGCKETATTLAALFQPVVLKAMRGQKWTEEKLAKTWKDLEKIYGQDQTFYIPEDVQAGMVKVWAAAGAGQQASNAFASDFFSAQINKMIDEHYEKVMANGYAELIIPTSLYDRSIIRMPQYHMDVMTAMNKLGYKTFVNGGAVRDGILGTPIHDVDFSTDATPEQMQQKLTDYIVDITLTGGGMIAQARHDNGDKTDMVPMRGINSSLKGLPGFPADGTYGPSSTSLLDDTYGRDLTINSMYYDYQTGDIIDYHGGMRDLRDHVIRTVYDANIMFPINASAIIRTVRFAARYGFDIDEATGDAIRKHLHYCDSLRSSLLNFYITKGFSDGCQSRTYQYYLKYGVLDRYVTALKGYLHDSNYQKRLFAAFDYIDQQKGSTSALAQAAMFLPAIEKELGDKAPTLKNITATWDKMESESGQIDHFLVDDFSMVKTDMMNIFYLYKKMSDGKSFKNAKAVKEVMANRCYAEAVLLLNGYQKTDSTLTSATDFWK